MKKAASRFLTFGLSVAMLFGLVTVSHATTHSVVVDASAAESTYTGTYYNGITADSGTQLLGQLHDLITTTHKKYTSYDDCKDPSLVKKTDPGTGGALMEFYAHANLSSSWQNAANGTWNREHVWPQSLSNGLWGKSGAGGDLHHIRPTENRVNSARSNNKFGEINGGTEVWYRDSSNKNIALAGHKNGETSFEPNDDVKGDVARIVMYVYTHYNTYSNVGGTTNGSGSASFGTLHFNDVMLPSSESEAIKLVLKWNEDDPVDSLETTRNEAVYEIQGNRNPFIDHPEFASAIWGDGTYTPNPDGGDGGGTQGGGTTEPGGSTTPSTDAFQPITSPVAGTEYYLGMKTYDGAYHYLTGNMAPAPAQYYMATTTNIAEATKVTLAGDNTNGWTLKCANGKYVEIELSGTHVNAVYVTSSRGTWKWNTEKSLFVWETGGNTYYLGTHGQTLTTVGGSDIAKYPVEGAEQWKVVLGTYGTQQGGTEPGGGGSQGGTEPGGGGSTEPGGGGGTVTPPAGGNGKITITLDSFDFIDGYNFQDWTSGGISGVAFIYGGNVNYPDSPVTDMQFSKPKSGYSYYLTNTTAVPGAITSIKVVAYGQYSNNWSVVTSDTSFGEVEGKPTGGTNHGTKSVSSSGETWTVSGDDTYFAIVYETTEYAGHLASIEITYATGGSQGGGSTEPGGSTHTHSFTYEVFDEDYHLKSCTGCDDVEDVAEAHVYSDDNDTTCDLCGYERTIEQGPSEDPGTGDTPSENPGTGDTPIDSNEGEQKSGCGGVIGGVGIAAVLVIAAAALCIVIVEKKRQ